MRVALNKKDFIWAGLSSSFNGAFWFLLILISGYFLSKEEVAILLTFIVIGNISLLFEFGFVSTLSRNLTYVYAGSQTLQKKGLDKSNKEINYKLFAEIIGASNLIFKIIGVFGGFILYIFGILYLFHTINNELDLSRIISACTNLSP